MSDESIYSSREEFIKKSKRSKLITYADSGNRIRRSSNSGLRRLKHRLKNKSVRNFYTIFGFTLIALFLFLHGFIRFVINVINIIAININIRFTYPD